MESYSTEAMLRDTTPEPFVILSYGVAGIGKTVDQGYSFPTALFVAAPGALNSIKAVCGYIPSQTEVKNISEATALVKKVSDKGSYKSIVFDDFSFISEMTFAELENKKLTGYKLWGELRDQMLNFRDVSRYCGINVIMNAWESPSKIKNGVRVRGGPQLPSNLPESIPALCDMVLRAVQEPARKPWPAAYLCSNDPGYVMKDRFHIASMVNPAPMNLAELIRASGRKVERLPHLGWQEEMVEKISTELSGVPATDAPKVKDYFKKVREAGAVPEVAIWTLRDAIDRAVIREQRKANLEKVFDFTPTGFPG